MEVTWLRAASVTAAGFSLCLSTIISTSGSRPHLCRVHPHHRLVLRVCACLCPLVCGCTGLCLTSVQRVSKCNGHLFLKKSITTTPTPTSQGPSAYCWPGPVITLSINCPSSLSSGFSLKEKLGSTGPGVSRTKTAVLRQRRSPGKQIQ